MFDFHYNYVKTTYGFKASLCFTDTDSRCYDITTNDVYLDMQRNHHHLVTIQRLIFFTAIKTKRYWGK